jgi:hypothetical protein
MIDCLGIVVPLEGLKAFNADELQMLVCGWSSADGEQWNRASMLRFVACLWHVVVVLIRPLLRLCHNSNLGIDTNQLWLLAR